MLVKFPVSLSQNSAVIIWCFATLSPTRAVFKTLEFSLEKLRLNSSQNGSNLHQNGISERTLALALPSQGTFTCLQSLILYFIICKREGFETSHFQPVINREKQFPVLWLFNLPAMPKACSELQFPSWNIQWHSRALAGLCCTLYCNKSSAGCVPGNGKGTQHTPPQVCFHLSKTGFRRF